MTNERLLRENADLRARLAEAEDALRAIREGEVDAVVVSGSKGERVFALTETDNLPRLMVETMNEAGLATTPDGLLVFCNDRAAALLGRSNDGLLGHDLGEFVAAADLGRFRELIGTAGAADARIEFLAATGAPIPMHVWASRLDRADDPLICLVGTDLSRVETDRKLIAQLEEQHEQLRGARRRAEQASAALRESEAVYRAIGESIDYGVWVCAPDGRNTYASESFLKMVGITQEQCSDFGWGNVLHPDDSERTIAAWRECVRTGGIWDIEHRFRGVDGQWHHVLARGVPVKNDKGELISWAGINLDIDRLKRAEEALRESEERLRLFVRYVPVALAMFDREMRYLRVSRRWLEDYGLADRDVIGLSHDEIFPEIPDRWRDAYRRGLAGEIIAADADLFDRADGAIQWIRWEVRPWHAADGTVGGIVVFTEDITARRRSEDEARRLHEIIVLEKDRLAALVNSISDEVWFADTAGRFSLVNASAKREFALDGSGATDIRELAQSLEVLRPDGGPRPVDEAPPLRALRGEEVRGQEELIRTPVTGELRYRQVSSSPVKDAAGNIIGAVSVVRDITELKRAEGKLRESEARLRLAQGYGGVGVWDWNVQDNQLAFEPELEQLYGLAPGSIRTYQDWASRVAPSDLARIEAERTTALAGRQQFQVEFRVRHATGTERWIMAKGRGEYDGAGRLLYVRGINIDITDRKQAEEALDRLNRELEERVARRTAELENAILSLRQSQYVIDHVHDAVFWLGPDGGVLFGNDAACAMTGYPAEGLASRALWDFDVAMEPADWPGWWQQSKTAGATVVERRFRAKDGRVFPVEVSPNYLQYGGRKFQCLLVRDISERRQLERQIYRISEEEKQRFAAELHDSLCQELCALIYLMMDLEEDLAAGPATTIGKAKRIRQVLAETLDGARRLSHSMAFMIKEPEGLMVALENLAATMTRLHRVHCAFRCKHPVRMDDPQAATHLYRIAQETVHNAIRHGGPSRITIWLDERGDDIRLIIFDNGSGMTLEALEQAGIGLKTMQYRASQLGGRFTVGNRQRGGVATVCSIPRPAGEKPGSTFPP